MRKIPRTIYSSWQFPQKYFLSTALSLPATYSRLDMYIWKSEILVPYLNNPSEETIFGSNKIKEQRNNETSK